MYLCTTFTAHQPAARTNNHRHGMPWESAEKHRLTMLRAQGVAFTEIARLLGRTEAAVRAQANKPAPGAAGEHLPNMPGSRMRGDELLEQRDRTGLTFEQLAARAGILSGPAILYIIAAGKNQLSPRYTTAIRDLPDARRTAPAPAPSVPAASQLAPGFVNITVPEQLAAAFQVIVHAMGAQQ
ncbi:hypothetical protein ACFVHI_19105 [Kitasatospora sp. NPDC127121]|uniref:hypothetical protein n=1 Tax=Kitasatospora sp. NPDC127121 TaxID=3345371 RepID=UPI0036327BAE